MDLNDLNLWKKITAYIDRKLDIGWLRLEARVCRRIADRGGEALKAAADGLDHQADELDHPSNKVE